MVSNEKFFNLTEEEQQQILDYKLTIYVCEGQEREKLDWFSIVNIAGEVLTEQELRNSLFTGPWLIDAKRHFSMTNCPAFNLAKLYVKGSPIRQDFLQTSLKWISNNNIATYMSNHQHDTDANELWLHFQKIINWAKLLFPTYRKEMKGIDWGTLYNLHKNTVFNSNDLEDKVKKLMLDEDITKKPGIYSYLITGQEKYLSVRAFSDRQKREAFERQEGICPKCMETFTLTEMEADHITPWSEGGQTVKENCQMLCKKCNRLKSNK